MPSSLKTHAAELIRLQQKFTAGELSPVGYRNLREPALAHALRAMAVEHGIDLDEALGIDANGEYSIIAKHPEGPLLTRGCGQFGEAFAAALTRHHARCGILPATLCPENGWCRLHHLDAERMVLAYAQSHPEAGNL